MLPKITFIGAGNVAWHLAPAFENAGYPVVAVYSQHPRSAARLAARLYDATAQTHLDFTDSPARLFVLAVRDDALPDVAAQLTLPPGATVVHTSGSTSLDTLQYALTAPDATAGVFYPLQTFSQDVPVDLSTVPLCLEAADAATEATLVQLAQAISGTVYLVSSAERQTLHVAAVFAGNFTNHLLAVAHQLTQREGLEFALLKPLIAETVRKALLADDPATVQTGPARRGDARTIRQHLAHLHDQPHHQHLYRLLTNSIAQQSPDE